MKWDWFNTQAVLSENNCDVYILTEDPPSPPDGLFL